MKLLYKTGLGLFAILSVFIAGCGADTRKPVTPAELPAATSDAPTGAEPVLTEEGP